MSHESFTFIWKPGSCCVDATTVLFGDELRAEMLGTEWPTVVRALLALVGGARALFAGYRWHHKLPVVKQMAKGQVRWFFT